MSMSMVKCALQSMYIKWLIRSARNVRVHCCPCSWRWNGRKTGTTTSRSLKSYGIWFLLFPNSFIKTKKLERILTSSPVFACRLEAKSPVPQCYGAPIDSFSLKSPLKVRDHILRTMKISNPSGIKSCEFWISNYSLLSFNSLFFLF